MNFSPLGRFDANAPIAPSLLVAARAFAKSLPHLPDGSFFERGYLHWTVAAFGCLFCDYDAEADYEHGVWTLRLPGNVLGNARGERATESAHTWHRNAHAFGIALAGMDGATETNFGNHGVTLAGIDMLLAGAAAVSIAYGIDATGTVDGYDAYSNPVIEPTWMTHAEAAVVDKYFPGDGDPGSRWDFATTVPLPNGVKLKPWMATTVGNAFRQRVHVIKLALEQS